MEAAAAKVGITPPGNVEVHDEIHSRIAILRNREVAVCVINFDLLNIDKQTTATICRLVEERTGIPPSGILIACTHNHKARIGPPPLTTSDGKGGYKMVDRGCLDRMVGPVVEGVVAAQKALAPAQICAGSGKFATPLVDNDRYLLRDKTIGWWWNDYTEEDIITPTGPVDPEVGVLHVKGAGGETIAVLYNYSCHADAFEGDALGTARGADYPGLASEFLEKRLGGTAVFTAGASGDIHPVGVWLAAPDDARKRHELAHLMAEQLGMTVERVVRRMTRYQGDVRLSGAKRIVPLPIREPGIRDEEDIIRTLSREKLKSQKEGMLARCRFVAQHARANRGKKIDAIIQVLKIGDFALVGIPGELFVEYGIEIKKRSSSPFTFVATLANDDLGYMPTETAFQLGGYQTWPLYFEEYPAPSVGRTLVEESLDLISTMA